MMRFFFSETQVSNILEHVCSYLYRKRVSQPLTLSSIKQCQCQFLHMSSSKDLPKQKSKIKPQQSHLTRDSGDIKSSVTKLGNKSSYVKDNIIARKLVKAVLRNRVNPQAPILDIQAGQGIVSSEFLREGVSQVIALEKQNIFKPQLLNVQEEFGRERFQYFTWHMLNFFYKFNDSMKDENHTTYRASEAKVVNLLSKSPFAGKGTPYSIFSTGGRQENQDVIFYILRNLPHEDQILSQRRVEFFLIVHPKFKASMEMIDPVDQPSHYTRQYSYFHTLMSLLYDVQFIEEFDVTDFTPPFFKTILKNGLNTNKRHLMRMQIKKNISHLLPFEHHHAFSIFLRHIFHKRRTRIIPAMEMLVNGCGLRMLANGFSMMDTIDDTSPQRLLHLYKDMVMWPEYSVSHLKYHIEMRTQGGPVKVETSDVLRTKI